MNPRLQSSRLGGRRGALRGRVRLGLAATGLALLSACASGLLPKAPAEATLLSLDAGQSRVAVTPPRPGAKTLIVETPRAGPGYDTRDFAYSRRDHQIEYFAKAQWADKPALMLAPLIARALQSSGAFNAVVPAPTAAIGAWRLETELLRLEQDFTLSPSQLHLTVRAVMIEVASRRVLASREFDLRVAAPSDDPYGGAVAANRAVAQWLAELAAFSAQAVPP